MSSSERIIASYACGASGARAAARSGAAVVVVDAFRASTTISVLVCRGARVVPAASLDEALSVAADLRIGERGGARVAGFDFGNSPTELLEAEIQPGSTLALSTTNGTRIIEAAADAPHILAGAFVNAGALAEVLCRGDFGPAVALVGCGWEESRAVEDECAAGAILHRMARRGAVLDERAWRAAELYRRCSVDDLRESNAARRLKRLGYEKDLDLCLAEDTVPAVPQLLGGVFSG